mmetsp:Transcript_23207/g.69513  ORF Transcript_23207/g.69513 Transcript_23207/m.69513 type:complete len:380 (-) Transcript_23207:31-1170(-)
MSRKPADTAWSQQKIPSYAPLLTPASISAIIFGIGAVCLTIGLSVRSVQVNDMYQRKVQYDGDGTPSENRACKIEDANEAKVCQVEIRLQEKMPSPVYVYYEIDGFYQNHNRYMTSYDEEQLLGANKDSDDLAGCQPLKKNGDKTLHPCGVLANSMFNDVIALANDDVHMRENHIAWPSDLHKKFKQPNGFDWATTSDDVSGCLGADGFTCSDAICDAAGVPSGCMGYVCKGGDFDDHHCAPGQDAVYFYRSSDEYQFLYQTFPDIVSPILGVKNEHFVVWMRAAGLPDFRKLYGRITSTLDSGDILTFNVTNNFNVKSFDGRKYLVVSLASPLGGNATALWQAFTYLGAACCGLALLFLAKAQTLGARKLGDTAFLRG